MSLFLLHAMRNLVFILLFTLSCSQTQDIEDIKAYDGPTQVGENVVLHYSEETRITSKLEAQKWLQFENGDQEFPEGIYLEFYGEKGDVTSTLTANEAYFFKEENKWRGRGDVIIQNIEEGQQLNTEELYWFPSDEKMTTEKFVTIKMGNEVLYGRGLEAAQDFSWYVLKNPEGDFYIDE